MAITENQYTGDGSTVLYSFTFPYLETTDIKVSLNGTVTTAYTLANATTIQFNTAPVNGAAIRIYRVTDDAALSAQFYPGSAIRSTDLNDNFTQNLYVTQESNNNATTAITTANTALTNSNSATSTANTALSQSTTALSNSSTALSQSNTAISDSATALSQSNTAISDSAAAVSTANTASSNASAAVSTANTASSNASAAVSTANTASSNASAAVSTANTASSNATTAVNTANNALSAANAAQSTANTADANANAALNAIAGTVQYVLVANVAAIPSTPGNGDAIEIADSTGIESFTPITNLPAGFVGDSGLSVRLQYLSAGSSWNWLNYFPNNADTRYLKFAGGTITGNLEIGNTGSLTFEGSTANAFETTFAVTDPTADRTITLPDVSGTVVTTGDTGSVTSTMIADGTIVDGDLNASAAIAGTKISPDFGSQTITTTGVVSAAAGAAATPSITFTGDTNTGIYSPGADQVAVATNGAQRITVDASGRLLVGTSTARSNVDGATPQIQLEGTTETTSTASIIRNSASGGGSVFVLGKSRSASVGGNTIVNSGDTIGTVAFEANDGTNFISAAGIFAQVDGTPGASDMPGRLVFSTTADGGSSPSERLRITSAGLVGIGVSSPSSLLHLQGSASNLVRAYTTDTGTSNVISVNNDSNYHYGILGTVSGNGTVTGDVFGLGYTSVLTSDFTPVISWTANTNRVGIGTTSPAFKLDVQENTAQIVSRLLNTATSTSSIATQVIAGNNGSTVYQVDVDGLGTVFGGGARLGTYTNHPLGFATNNTERARIDSSGKLLVGTSAALTGSDTQYSKIQIQNNTFGTDTPAYFALSRSGSLTSTDLPVGRIWFGGSGTDLRADISAFTDGASSGSGDTPGRLVFSTTADGASSPTERMRIKQDGGTHVFGTADIIYAARSGYGAGTTYMLFQGAYNASGTLGTGTESYRVFTNGNVQNTNNSYTGISDAKLKENIVNANSQWDDIKALQVRNYNFKEGQTHTQIGLVAQEVELVSPGLVSESPDRDDEGNDLGTVTKSVNYSVLYMKAVKALQEAIAKIETLEGMVAVNNITIDEQQHQLSTLAARLTALESA